MTIKRYGFWSAEFVRRGHRTDVWTTPAGAELEVCFVGTSTTAPNAWPDIVLLGEVVEWKRQSQVSIRPPCQS